MPRTIFTIAASAKAEVVCGDCERQRVPAEHPQATVCERDGCTKTIIEPLDGDEEG